MASPDDDPERALRRSLLQIEDAADLICRGIGFFDPDRLAATLGAETAQLRGALAELMGEPAGEPGGAGRDLSLLASSLAGLLDGQAAPLSLSVTAGELPPAAASADELRAAVRRLLQIGVTHAGSGGVVTVDPRTIDGDPALLLVARPAPGASAASVRSAQARCSSLADFAGDLGGALELSEHDQGGITALLRFPRGPRAPQ